MINFFTLTCDSLAVCIKILLCKLIELITNNNVVKVYALLVDHSSALAVGLEYARLHEHLRKVNALGQGSGRNLSCLHVVRLTAPVLEEILSSLLGDVSLLLAVDDRSYFVSKSLLSLVDGGVGELRVLVCT